MSGKTAVALAGLLFVVGQVACSNVAEPVGASPSSGGSPTSEANPLQYPWEEPTQAAAAVNELKLEHAGSYSRMVPSPDTLVLQILDDGALSGPLNWDAGCIWTARLEVQNNSEWLVEIKGLKLTLRDTEGNDSEYLWDRDKEGQVVGTGSYALYPGRDPDQYEFFMAYFDTGSCPEDDDESPARVVAVDPVDITWTPQWRDEISRFARDAWVLSNPTDRALSFRSTLTLRDSRGMFLRTGDADGCPDRASSWGVVDAHLIWLPPHSSVVLSHDLYQEDYEAGVQQELTVETLTSCDSASFYADYDPDVVLESHNEASDLTTFVVANHGSREAVTGVFYLSILAADGTPLYGTSLAGLGSDGLPPGERTQVQAGLPDVDSLLLGHNDLVLSDYQFLWVGMSR